MEDSIMHRMGDSPQDSGNKSPNGDNEGDDDDDDPEGDTEADAEGEAFPEPIIDRGEMIEQNDQEYVQSPHSSFSYDEDSNEEIDGISNNNIILEYPNLEFKLRDCYELSDEINDWFTSNEIKSLLSIRKIYESYVHPNDNLKFFHKMSQDDKVKFLRTLSMNLESNDNNKKECLFSIISLSYISMGNYGKIENQFNHINQIKTNCKLLNFKLDDNQTILNPIIKLIVKYLNKLTNFKKNVSDNKFNFEELHNIDLKLLKSYADQLYHLMTILYFCLCIYLDEEDKNNYDNDNIDGVASDSDSDEEKDEDYDDDHDDENADIFLNNLDNENGINVNRLKNGKLNKYKVSKNINKKSAKLYSVLKTRN
ncbi:unnamed protein product [[Candida] boidinii]|nr:unnamed protein product [[Candida] boidinii]